MRHLRECLSVCVPVCVRALRMCTGVRHIHSLTHSLSHIRVCVGV